MFILGDEGHYHGRFPWVTACLVVINIGVFVAQVRLGPAFTLSYALVPAELPKVQDVIEATQPSAPSDTPQIVITNQNGHQGFARTYYCPTPVLTLVTSLFLHVDIFHLLGNMWFLLVFGRNVECAMNHVLFLTFYLVCGVAAGVAHTLSDAGSIIPTIGASGAISGIMGAYISIHPLNKIKIWLFIAVVEWPALVVIGLWFVDNYLCAFLSLENAATHGGVAHWAHLGGFVAGFVILRTLVMCLQIKRRVAGRRDKPSEPAQVEAADPFGTFISVQTVRKMRDQAP